MATKRTSVSENGKSPVKIVEFSAIAKQFEDNLPDATERMGRKHYVEWGSDNRYPFFIRELYENVPTLESVIDGCVDYICGDGIIFNGELQGDPDVVDTILGSRGETVEDTIREIALEKALYDGFALEIIRTKDQKDIANINVLPLRYLRTDDNHEVFYYNEGFGDKWNKKDSQIIPKFLPEKKQDRSVLFVKGAGLNVYPRPIYGSAVIPCAIEMEVNRYHYNSIRNGFMGSYIFAMNTGLPTDQQREEIEREFNEKYCGSENAGNVMLVWTRGKEFAPTAIKMDVQDFGEKYDSLVKRSRQQIFTSFRANPNLFGIPTENNGFNAEEYRSTFSLFNKTTIAPMQRNIVSAINRIYGRGVMEIQPFDIGGLE